MAGITSRASCKVRTYAARISLNPWVFVLAVMSILLLAMVTVSSQTIRTAVDNPVNSLKQE
jgi:putative ABC transport system permease protein